MTAVDSREGLRTVTHPWVGRLVVDKRTGRRGRLGSVVEHLERPEGPDPERVTWREAHVRPLDGSGIEWQANITDLRRLPAEEPGR